MHYRSELFFLCRGPFVFPYWNLLLLPPLTILQFSRVLTWRDTTKLVQHAKTIIATHYDEFLFCFEKN